MASTDIAQLEAIAEKFREDYVRTKTEIEKAVVGHEEIIDGVLTCLFAGGHALLEGVPGLGKTLLIRSLSEALHLQFNRIQFTPDLMPADVTGTTIVVEGGGRPRLLSSGKRADLLADRARRRDQPRHAEDAVGAARGDAGEVRSRSAARRTSSTGRSS